MTAGDFISADDNQALDQQGPTYPTAFGIEFTPKIQAIAIAIAGLVGAYFLYQYLVKPVQEQKTTLEQQVAEKEQQVQQQEANLKKIEALEAELATAMGKRAAVYELLGTPQSLDTLLLDINQQIQNSNAAISDVLRADFDKTGGEAQLAALGLNSQQIAQVRNLFANDPVIQKLLYTSELFAFNPTESIIIEDGSYGDELDGKLQRYSVEVSLQALFPQTLNILRNIERLEPLVEIRDFRQEIANPPEGVNEEDLGGISRLLDTQFTLDVLVPVNDPAEPPALKPAEPEEEGKKGGKKNQKQDEQKPADEKPAK